MPPEPINRSVLPCGLVPERRTPEFNVSTVPKGLLKAHHTTVWAELHIVGGQVTWVDEETGDRTGLAVGDIHVIEPHRRHHIEPAADARFSIQFYVDPGNGGRD